MSALQKCPGCGELVLHERELFREFLCGSETHKNQKVFQSRQCLRNQRDQLAERVKELEGEVADYRKLFCDWKAYATNLESVGKQMLDGGFHAPHIISLWREAEDTRP